MALGMHHPGKTARLEAEEFDVNIPIEEFHCLEAQRPTEMYSHKDNWSVPLQETLL